MHNTISAALDQAIAETARAEYNRITETLDDAQRELVIAALDSLHGSIRTLNLPQYNDDLVALLYSVWYHPFQTNAALSLMGRIFRASPELPTDNNPLQIVDFGCGALAYEFGLLLALQSSAIQRVGMDVSVSLFEPNSAMLRVGMHIWRRWLDLTGHDARIDVGAATSTVRVGTATIRLARISQFPRIHPQPDAQRWLVAMHAYYSDSKCSIKGDL